MSRGLVRDTDHPDHGKPQGLEGHTLSGTLTIPHATVPHAHLGIAVHMRDPRTAVSSHSPFDFLHLPSSRSSAPSMRVRLFRALKNPSPAFSAR